MDVTISAKHMELTPSLKSHVNERMIRLKKYTDHHMNVDVSLGVEKYRNKIHASVKGKGFKINSEAEEPDSMYKAIDLCVDKLETQLRRGKHNPKAKKINKKTIRTTDTEEELSDESLVAQDQE
jgi:putative sigma-54 modulation protein